ncbi:Activator of Hsp90 ATPase homolog 1-like protein [Serratia quinivorans]|uniref:SRPBCC family protein n=1 Tax=Serratia quinivorans TaxID=137545 RepID=UPI0021796F86|nr:SRPBCC family protein [Serratia quinivorans]CAI0798239.1 Activator of Hsp90 ATPase homolog 1-like protein [Serratia quinivorans]CAI0814774.1 Activator of Hsp90 ATPase homolog 1-like protein [Serratia quinivorans]CAI1607255.1 Activator of Hsp90 ATPase homolog 1-like protein [Serratia quinivorans]CAI2061486.1 Activator of Hsp90 ATPase homolog 1-like protein [Serratia quinivorans]CAI2402017.1 Activator of Hsp90 ATPase homolog 1-like protein [Serratia quinivorans]
MNDYGMIIETGTLRIQRLLPGPIERVWAYLTESDKRATWLAAGDMKLESGAQVELVFRNSDLTGEHEPAPAKYKNLGCSVSNVGHITCLFPPRLLSFTWAEQGQNRPSEVTFELTEQGNAVLLTVTHRRLANRDEMLSVAGGWHTHLDILVDRLYDRQPQPFWSTHARLEEEYRARL